MLSGLKYAEGFDSERAIDSIRTVQTFTADVARIEDLTHDVRVIEVRLREPGVISFEAGQFVSFKIEKDGLRFPLTRVYSIASPPSRNSELELLFNRVPDGPGSSFLFGLRVGDTISFDGPAGTFVVRDYPDRDLLFVATGTGIAPLRSMLQAKLREPSRPIRLLWGLRSEPDLYYQDELRTLADRHPQFSFQVTLSRPLADWTGATGYVQELVRAEVNNVDHLAVYVCGNSAMIKEVVAILRSLGVCPIHREQYYRD